MSHSATARRAGRERGAYRYQRHRPEQTLLYQIVEQHYPAFTAHLAERGIELPGYVQDEFEAYLKCGRLEHGFLRVRRESCHAGRSRVARFSPCEPYPPATRKSRSVIRPAMSRVFPCTSAKRGKGNKRKLSDALQDPRSPERRASITWAQRLKRVFSIDIETCECGGAVKVIACIENPIVIKKILDHLKERASPAPTNLLPEGRAPPPGELFG